MQAAFQIDDFGRLECELTAASGHAAVNTMEPRAALDALRAALEDAEREGLGECFWDQEGGEHRWVFRRDGAAGRVVVLWSNGVVTGWEHVFSHECDFAALAGELRRAAAVCEAA